MLKHGRTSELGVAVVGLTGMADEDPLALDASALVATGAVPKKNGVRWVDDIALAVDALLFSATFKSTADARPDASCTA